MVEPPHPLANAERAPRHPVVERADTEHRRERDGVDPHREPPAPRVGERDEHHAGRHRYKEGVLVEDASQAGPFEEFHCMHDDGTDGRLPKSTNRIAAVAV